MDKAISRRRFLSFGAGASATAIGAIAAAQLGWLAPHLALAAAVIDKVPQGQPIGKSSFGSDSASFGRYTLWYTTNVGDSWDPWREGHLLAGGQEAFCIEAERHFEWGECDVYDAVASGMFTQELATRVALMKKFIYEDSATLNSAGASRQFRYYLLQTYIWNEVGSRLYATPFWAIIGEDETPSWWTGSVMERVHQQEWPAYYNANASKYIGEVKLFRRAGAQMLIQPSLRAATGKIRVVKKSANEGITRENSNYSLAGAKFGVYADAACTRKECDIITSSDGVGESQQVASGTWHVREDVAPKGFIKNSTVFAVTVAPGGTATVNG